MEKTNSNTAHTFPAVGLSEERVAVAMDAETQKKAAKILTDLLVITQGLLAVQQRRNRRAADAAANPSPEVAAQRKRRAIADAYRREQDAVSAMGDCGVQIEPQFKEFAGHGVVPIGPQLKPFAPLADNRPESALIEAAQSGMREAMFDHSMRLAMDENGVRNELIEALPGIELPLDANTPWQQRLMVVKTK